jgi:uncharacterized protein (TIGR02001 family)
MITYYVMLVFFATAAASDDSTINVNVTATSAYVFRGINVFQEDNQQNMNAIVAPGAILSIGTTGLSIGYWGAFQVTGDNIDANIASATGAEQDIYASYSYSLNDKFSLATGVCWYMYPMADPAMNSAWLPSYLEPSIALGWAGPVSIDIKTSYVWGVQEQPSIRGVSYLYIPVAVGKSLIISNIVGVDLSAGYGFKLCADGNDDAVNVHDVLLTAGAPMLLGRRVHITPQVTTVWTNLTADFADELATHIGVSIGAGI